MALENPTTREYYRIVNIHLFKEVIECEIYENQEHRIKGDSKYQKKTMKQYRVKSIFKAEEMANNKKSARDNVLVLGYAFLKTFAKDEDGNGDDFINYNDV